MQKTSQKKMWLVVLTLLALTFSALNVTPVQAAVGITVQSAADDGTAVPGNCPGANCRLRDAIAAAAPGDTINFGGDYTILLVGELAIGKNLTIDGTGHMVTVSGNHLTRVFMVTGITLSLNQLTIINGLGLDGEGGGGAYVKGGGVLNVSNSTFSNNSAYWPGGGGINAWSSTVNVSNSTFSNNSAISGGYGGGISTLYGTLNATNSTFSGNSAQNGGGGISASGPTSLINCTISGNSSGWASSGGINNEASTSLWIKNSIIANNSGNNCFSHYGSGYPFYGSNNQADDSSCGAGFTNSASILLGTLGDYGGRGQTYPLLPGSSAINATNADCPAADQRGVARAATCDIGAFQSQGFSLMKTNGNNQSAVITTNFAQPLALFVTANNGSEPVNGGVISFSAPTNALSPSITNTSIKSTISDGAVLENVTANSVFGGPYSVTASAAGAVSTSFALTNLPDTTPPVVTVPANKTAEAIGPSGAGVTFAAATATDLVSGAADSNLQRQLRRHLPARHDHGDLLGGRLSGQHRLGLLQYHCGRYDRPGCVRPGQ